MTSKPPDPESVIGRVAARLGRSVDVALMDMDLSASQYRLLLQLAEGTEASTSLAKKLAVTAPSVTAVVDGLVQRGLVQRRQDEEDRRRIALTLTEEGHKVLERADAAVTARLYLVASGLDEDSRQIAFAGMRAWEAALNAFRSRRADAPTAELLDPLTEVKA